MSVLQAIIDIGKTHSRLSFITEKNHLHSCLTMNSAVVDGLYPNYPVDEIFAWILAGLKAIAVDHQLKAIVVITHGAAIALCDSHGLVLPIMDYEFTGPEEYSAEYDLQAADFEVNGSPRLPAGLNLGRQLYWQHKKYPQEFERATNWLLYPQYWAWRLSGVMSAEVSSLGCHTDLWEPQNNDFTRFAKQQGWNRRFPEIRPAWDCLGGLDPAVAAVTNLAVDCEVYCGMHDSNASFMLQKMALKQPFILLSTGTWLVAMSASINQKPLLEDRDTLCFSSAWGDAVPGFRFPAGIEYAAIAGADGMQQLADPDSLAAVIAQQIYAYPAFSSLGGPFQACKGIINTAIDDPAERAALAAVYCAMLTVYGLALIAVKGDIVIEGPFAKNRLYPPLLASLMPERQVLLAPYENSIVSAGNMLCQADGKQANTMEYSRVQALEISGLAEYYHQWLRDSEQALQELETYIENSK